MWNNIYRVGIELEGGWAERPPTRLHHDGSVTVRARHVGEVSSSPLTEGRWKAWMEANHPSSVNASCGLHVHVSVTSRLAYMALMEPEFRKHLISELRRWGQATGIDDQSGLYYRLDGRNHFCSAADRAEAQASASVKIDQRYSQVNCCARLHGTVEIRVLPMFATHEVGVAAVARVIEIVESYLAADLGPVSVTGRGTWMLVQRAPGGPEVIVKTGLRRSTMRREGMRRGVRVPSVRIWCRGTDGFDYRIRFVAGAAVGGADEVQVHETEAIVEEVDAGFGDDLGMEAV